MVGMEKIPSSKKAARVRTDDVNQPMTYAGLKRLAWEHASEISDSDHQGVFVEGFLAGYMCSGVGLAPERPKKK